MLNEYKCEEKKGGCGEIFEQESRRGRPPVNCPSCRERNAPKPKGPRVCDIDAGGCGKEFHHKRRGRAPKTCDECRGIAPVVVEKKAETAVAEPSDGILDDSGNTIEVDAWVKVLPREAKILPGYLMDPFKAVVVGFAESSRGTSLVVIDKTGAERAAYPDQVRICRPPKRDRRFDYGGR